ncbi:MAG: hypothetical protein ACTSPY_09500 [Candidatus Helarchaeota archaeon]
MEIYKIVISFIIAILLIVAGIIIYKRNPNVLLNRIILLALESYAIFFTFDAFIGLFYFNYLLANLCRNISSSFALIGHSNVFLGSYSVLKGKHGLKNPIFIIPFLSFTICAIILGQIDYNDWVDVDIATQSYIINNNFIGLFFNYIYHGILIFISLGIYLYIYFESENPKMKSRIKFLIIGLAIIIGGQIIQIILFSIIETSLYYFLIFPDAIVYSLWASGIIIIVYGFQK